MNNVVHIAVYGVLALVTCYILVSTCRRQLRSRLGNNMLFAASMMLCWQLAQVAYYANTSLAAGYYLYDLDLAFLSLTVLGIFLYVMQFYSIAYFSAPAIRVVLFIIPLFNLVLALTPFQQQFFRTYLEVVSVFPHLLAYSTRGVWFWIHTGYCYILIMITLCVTLYQHRHLPKPYRLPSTLLMLGILASVGCNVLMLLDLPVELDISLIGASITLTMLYAATVNNKGLDFLIRARQEVFNDLREAVFILDEEKNIMQANPAGESWLTRLGSSEEQRSFPAIAPQLFDAEPEERDEAGGVDFYFRDEEGVAWIFNLREKLILDNTGRRLGSLVLCNDVTENREWIQRLERDTGLDTLTGLSNRRRMSRLLQELDTDGRLPLAVIMGDMNNLKQTNDTLGHQQGDLLIRHVASLLVRACPPSAHVGRIGGDEFMILLTKCDPTQAKALVAELQGLLAAEAGTELSPSLALGYSVKELARQSLKEVLQKADAAMYEDKRYQKTEAGFR